MSNMDNLTTSCGHEKAQSQTDRVAELEAELEQYKAWLTEAIQIACAASNDAERELRDAGFQI